MSQHNQLPQPADLSALPADGGDRYNRLIFEKSPYLLQHAENPVDWYPWGEEAFAAAKEADKPIFLSIGYATCHWCHVMAHESFEDEAVAALLNRDFIAIKVDKEERPDIDDIYMTACMALNGHGGWPLTVLLAPDQQPFFAATYLPKASRGGRMGMLEFLPRIATYWAEDRAALAKNGEQLTATIRHYGKAAAGELGPDCVKQAYDQLLGSFDPNYGGFGNAPKFPTAHHLLLLLRLAPKPWAGHAYDMVALTLDAMRHGGIWDHVGYGFHRYSTDQVWLLPHFEKMLYDQAMLAMAYTDAYRAIGYEPFAQTARAVFEYVMRDMTHPEGGFFSAEDADSEGEEGKFYVWKRDEITAILGEPEGKAFCGTYQVADGGNFREEATGKMTGDSILHLAFDVDEEIDDHADARRPFDEACQKLFQVRESRIHPLKDDKILTDWNGLMLAAFARAYRALGDETYLRAARRAEAFVRKYLTKEDGGLHKRFRTGSAGLQAHLDDVAFMSFGYLELFLATSETAYLQRALDLVAHAELQFLDSESGAFFQTPRDGEPLIARMVKAHDGAIPSGNSVMAYVLAHLGRLTGFVALEEAAHRVVNAFAGQLNSQPQSSTFMVMAIDLLASPTQEIVIAGAADDPQAEAFFAEAQLGWHPRRLVIWNKGDAALAELMPFLQEMQGEKGATAYICQNYTCELPITDLETFRARLQDNG